MVNHKNLLTIISDIESETIRLQKRLIQAKEQLMKELEQADKGDLYSYKTQSAKFAAAKRAALDLKRELTKLTQTKKY